MKKHIVCFSGGKDSTAMLLKMIENNMPIDDIIFFRYWFRISTNGKAH